ncbi:HupE/UreJ family protein [Paenibacillus sp. MBLB4367]|uniref:HupE/UreJ family protein n=1 Tax=Paenibacillus sp. MBLB4367 TaxID=3384767 RepID=UPI00390809A5
MITTIWRHGFAVLLAFLLLWPFGADKAEAHLSTIGYSDITIRDRDIRYELFLDPQEVGQWIDSRSGQRVFVIDPKASQRKEGETGWKKEEIERLVGEGLTVKNGDFAAKPDVSDVSVRQRGDRQFVRMELSYKFPAEVDAYSISYDLFFDGLDPQHQNFAKIRTEAGTIDTVFHKNNRLAADKVEGTAPNMTNVEVPSWLATLLEYLWVGMQHIWTGYDHLLFLCALIILPQRKREYLATLTAFTVGHSVTIILSALRIVVVPAAVVEPLIALSIVYVAVENIWMKQLRWRWTLALGFGLIHGLGFAQILRDATVERFVLALFSFNVGVEIGQIAVLAVLLPVLLLAARWKQYRMMAYAISGLIVMIGGIWFVQRVFL